jgi:branched-chain amino acid transport system ATP-binding protein
MTVAMELREVRAGYGPVEVLHGVDLAFPAGHVVALLGRNGAGKTTTLRALAGRLPLVAGSVRWWGEDISRLTSYERARRGLVLIPDEHGIFADLTVEDNLTLFADGGPPDPAFEAFPILKERYGQKSGTLSGGEQQMLALSRTLLRQVRVVLLDEISRGLAPRVVAALYEVVSRLASEDRCVVVVEQYVENALALADIVYVLRRGEVSFAGEPTELDPQRLAVAFGGTVETRASG